VGVNLVSGRPISFTMDLYQPLYVTRPHVEPELFASLRPPTYTGAIDREQWGAPGAPPPPGKPSDDKARKDSKGEGKADKDGGLGAGGGGGFGGGRGLKEREELDLSKGVSSAAQAMNLGDYFSYEIDHSVSLGRQKSAMLPIINQKIDASRVSIYNEKVHPKFPLLGLRFKNNTDLHLTQGPITVFDGSTYAGDARILDLQPKEERLVSYAMDLGTEIVPVAANDNGRRTSVKIVKGVIQTNLKFKESKTYTIVNRSEIDRTVLVEQPFRSQFKLTSEVKPVETASDVYRFQVSVPKGKTEKLTVTEERDDGERIEINNSDDGKIQMIINEPLASKEIRDALQTSLKMKWDLAKTLEDIKNNQREQDRIKAEQPRLRENLKVLPGSDPLVKKIQDKLLAQENEIEKYEADIKTLQAKADKQRHDFESYLVGLTIEK
jgi:hypothetical protein